MTAAALAEKPARFGPALGLSTKFYLAIAGSVGFTLAASVIAWISFVELAQIQREVTGKHIPSITDSLRLARQSALIAASAPALISSSDEVDRQRRWKERDDAKRYEQQS